MCSFAPLLHELLRYLLHRLIRCCTTIAARNLSLFRSLAIFLFKAQSKGKDGKKSLPDFERHVHRKPGGLIRRFTQPRHEE